jgi:hypothetical protein
MGRLRGRRGTFAGAVAACGLAIGAAGCSSDLALFRADSSWWSSSGKSAASEPLSRQASADELMGPGGTCPPRAGEAPRAAGVGVGMTECEVVAALGQTPLVDIGADERGQRAVVLTYSEGEHAGIYRFTSGLLTSVEALPEKPKPQRPKARPHAKPKPKPKPAVAQQPRPAAPPQQRAQPPAAASPWPAPSTQPQPAPWPAPAAQPQPAPWPAPPKS